MGWLFKGFLVIVALVFLETGLWVLSLLIFGYLLYSLMSKKRKVQRAILVDSQEGRAFASGMPERRRTPRFEWHWRFVLGVILLVGALVAVGERGTYAPVVFGGAGILCLFWGKLAGSARFSSSTSLLPVSGSILLTPRVMPFVWVAVAEIKLSSQEATRALGVLQDNLIVTLASSEKPRLFLVLREIAASRGSAENKIAERLRGTAAILASRGAYLLPLDSQQVIERFNRHLEPVELELDDSLVVTIGHSQYDVLVVGPEGSRVRALGAYARPSCGGPEGFDPLVRRSGNSDVGFETESTCAILPGPRQKLENEPLLWEVISSLHERIAFSQPDSSTVFLNNMHVSRNVPLAYKMNLVSGGTEAREHEGGAITVESLGGTPVELSRTQLRTIVKIYG